MKVVLLVLFSTILLILLFESLKAIKTLKTTQVEKNIQEYLENIMVIVLTFIYVCLYFLSLSFVYEWWK